MTLCAADAPSPGSLNAIREVCHSMKRDAAEVIAHVSLSRAHALPANLPHGLRNLQRLSLYDVPLSDLPEATRMAGLIPSAAPLRAVQITRCGLQPSGLEALMPALARLTGLTELDLRGNCLYMSDALEAFGTLRHLRILDLSGCNIHEVAAAGLATGLRQMRWLERLDLSNNMLWKDGIVHLSSSALPYLTHLKHLGLGCVNMCSRGMEERLAPALAHLTRLTHLDVGDNMLLARGARALAQSLRMLPNLKHLRAPRIMEGSMVVEALAPALGYMTLTTTALQELNLGHNPLGSVEALLGALGTLHLRWLRLNDCSIGAGGVVDLSNALRALAPTLDLGKNGFGATEVTALCPALSVLSELQVLDLSDNDIGWEGIRFAPLPNIQGFVKQANSACGCSGWRYSD